MDDQVIYFLRVLEIIIIAGIKFAIAPFEAERSGFNFQTAFIITTVGGIIGIFIFYFIGEVIAFGWKKFLRYMNPLKQKDKPKKKFTWMRKFTVRTKMKFGLAGLIITTPAILSIPIGTLVIHRFYRKKWKNISLLCLSLIIWSLIINALAQYLKLSQYLS